MKQKLTRPTLALVGAMLCLTVPGCTIRGCVQTDTPPKPANTPTTAGSARPTEQPDTRPAPNPGLIGVFPGVRLDRETGIVEFDGVVPIDAHDPQTPVVFLELIACIPDTREHESLVMTTAKPSHIHAALLMAGLVPGAPGRKNATRDGVQIIAPTGDPLDVVLRYQDSAGQWVEDSPVEWIVHERDARRPADPADRALFSFSGSAMDRRPTGEVYRADFTGDLIGLATFADETIAWHEVFSPQAAVDEPVWIADRRSVPPMGTRVTVRLVRVRAPTSGR